MNITEKQSIARKKKLVSSAKAMISGQVGITVGAMAVANKLRQLGEEWSKAYPIFKVYYSELPMDLPIGSERLNWNIEKLLALDPELAQLEFKYRAKLFEACATIINKHG